MEIDSEREYLITFSEDNRADVAWYSKEDEPESISYQVSEDQVEVEGQESMNKITFDNFPTHSYGLSNSNDNSFLIDETEDGIVLRDFKESKEDNTIVLKKDFEGEFTSASEENDVYLIQVE